MFARGGSLQGRPSLLVWSRGPDQPRGFAGRRTQPARRAAPRPPAHGARQSHAGFSGRPAGGVIGRLRQPAAVPDWQQTPMARPSGPAPPTWRAMTAWLLKSGSALARAGAHRPPRCAGQLELLRCAAQATSLVAAPCSAFDAAACADATAAQLAHADYLAGRATPEQAALPGRPRGGNQRAGRCRHRRPTIAPGGRRRCAARRPRHRGHGGSGNQHRVAAGGWRRPLLAWLLLRAWPRPRRRAIRCWRPPAAHCADRERRRARRSGAKELIQALAWQRVGKAVSGLHWPAGARAVKAAPGGARQTAAHADAAHARAARSAMVRVLAEPTSTFTGGRYRGHHGGDLPGGVDAGAYRQSAPASA